MTSPAQTPPRWTRERWLLAAAIIFALQIGIIFLLAEHPRETARNVKMETKFHLLAQPLSEDQISKSFFANDPMLFVSASLHGFSGPAWLRRPAPNYDLSETNESAHWLTLNPEQLGKTMLAAHENATQLPLQISDEPISQIDSLPIFLSPETMRGQSALRMEGPLAARRLELRALLPSWARSELVTNSIVQVAANAAGEVISARLLARSGFADADQEALKISRTVRFHPEATAQKISWGKMIFEWNTVAPEPTNGVVKSQ